MCFSRFKSLYKLFESKLEIGNFSFHICRAWVQELSVVQIATCSTWVDIFHRTTVFPKTTQLLLEVYTLLLNKVTNFNHQASLQARFWILFLNLQLSRTIRGYLINLTFNYSRDKPCEMKIFEKKRIGKGSPISYTQKGHSFSAPKIPQFPTKNREFNTPPQFHSKNPSFPLPQFHSKNPSVPLQKPLSSTPKTPQFDTPPAV